MNEYVMSKAQHVFNAINCSRYKYKNNLGFLFVLEHGFTIPSTIFGSCWVFPVTLHIIPLFYNTKIYFMAANVRIIGLIFFTY
jgi:hypothetical protein